HRMRSRNKASAGGESQATKNPPKGGVFVKVAERTGLEPATSGVTGQHSNRLNYRSTFFTASSTAPMSISSLTTLAVLSVEWRPHGDSNPGRHRERVMS